MRPSEKNVFGRTYRNPPETVEYATVRTHYGYAVVCRTAQQFEAAPDRIETFYFADYEDSKACRAAAAAYALKLAREERNGQRTDSHHPV